MDLQKIRLIPSHSQLSFLVSLGRLFGPACHRCLWLKCQAKKSPWAAERINPDEFYQLWALVEAWKPLKTHGSEAWSDFVKILCFQLDVFLIDLSRPATAKDQRGILELDFRLATFFIPTALDVGTKHMHTATNAGSYHESDYTETRDLDVFKPLWLLYTIAYNDIENKNKNDNMNNMYTMHI